MESREYQLNVSNEVLPIEPLVFSHPYGKTVRTELLRDVLTRRTRWITPEDIVDNRAFVYLPPESRIELCHMAGAPFTTDPNHRLHDAQKAVITSDDREILWYSGSRAGKSVAGGCLAFLELSLPMRRVAIIAESYNLADKEFEYAYKAFGNLFGEICALTYDFTRAGNNYRMRIDTVWGSTLQVFTAGNDYLDSILGSEWDLAVLGEGSKLDAEIVNTKVIRSLYGRSKTRKSGFRQKTGRLISNCTPDGEYGYPNYRIELINKLTRGNPDWYRFGAKRYNFETETHEITPWEESTYIRQDSVLCNPAYSLEEFEAAKKRLGEDSPAFQEQFMGRSVRRTGVVLDRYIQGTHQFEELSREHLKQMRFGIGIDFGKNFGAVLIGQDREGKFYILGEVFNKSKLTHEDARAIKIMCIKHLGFLVDISGVAYREEDIEVQWDRVRKVIDLVWVDSAGQHKDDIQYFLKSPIGYTGGLEIIPTLRMVNDLFSSGRLFLNQELSVLPDEIKNLVWAPAKRGMGSETAKEVPAGARHVCDAMRYALCQMVALGPPKGPLKGLTFEEAYYQGHYLDDVTKSAIYKTPLVKEADVVPDHVRFILEE